jgi:hypothetical protein
MLLKKLARKNLVGNSVIEILGIHKLNGIYSGLILPHGSKNGKK